MAPSLELQSSLPQSWITLATRCYLVYTEPGSGKEEVVSGQHHQSHLHDLPDSQDHPHGGPAQDVAHVHPDLRPAGSWISCSCWEDQLLTLTLEVCHERTVNVTASTQLASQHHLQHQQFPALFLVLPGRLVSE